MKMLPCMDEWNIACSFYRWESRFWFLTQYRYPCNCIHTAHWTCERIHNIDIKPLPLWLYSLNIILALWPYSRITTFLPCDRIHTTTGLVAIFTTNRNCDWIHTIKYKPNYRIYNKNTLALWSYSHSSRLYSQFMWSAIFNPNDLVLVFTTTNWICDRIHATQ
jgi:hypothetical protein